MYSPSKNSCQSSEHSPAECGNYSQFKKPSGLENEDDIGSRAILCLRVYDPRILPETRAADVPGSPTTGTLCVLKAEAKKCAALAGISDKNKELPKLEGTFISHSNDNLWDISRGISPPVEESVLCMQRHHLRMDDFCLDVPNSGMLSTSTTHCSRYCPILLLKNNYQKGSLIG